MSVSDEYLAYLREQFAFLDRLRIKKMFGGAMLYADDLPFALVADDVLYFKVGENNRAAFDSAGMSQFQPFADKPMNMPYYELPADVLEDSDMLAQRTGEAIDAARAAKK